MLYYPYDGEPMGSTFENDTKGYIATVAKIAGIDPDRRIDVYDRHLMCSLAGAMSRVENGVPAVMADVEAGWDLL